VKKLTGVVILVAVLLAGLCGQASAQTPEPTATPTPSYMQGVTMSTGNTLLLVKSVTYGDIAITVALLLLTAVLFVVAMVTIPKKWLSK
jgi:ABC-type multidrug transport system permease subunit